MEISKNSVILCAIASIMLLLILSLAYAQVKIPKQDIPTDCPADVKKIIETFYSSSPFERYEAINSIAEMDSRAVFSIPWLIELLNDRSLAIARRGNVSLRVQDEGIILPICGFLSQPDDICIYVSDAAGNSLKVLTGQEFGQNYTKWQEWWDLNRNNYNFSKSPGTL